MTEAWGPWAVRGDREVWPRVMKGSAEKSIGWAAFRGNRQYVTTGNLAENDQAFLFLMDYASRTRVKLWGRARIVDDDSALVARLMHAVARPRSLAARHRRSAPRRAILDVFGAGAILAALLVVAIAFVVGYGFGGPSDESRGVLGRAPSTNAARRGGQDLPLDT